MSADWVETVFDAIRIFCCESVAQFKIGKTSAISGFLYFVWLVWLLLLLLLLLLFLTAMVSI